MKLRARTILTVGARTVLAGEEFETADEVLIDVLLRHGWAEVEEQKVEKQTSQTSRRKKNEG